MTNYTFTDEDRKKIISVLGQKSYSAKVYEYMLGKDLIKSNNKTSVRSYIRQVVNGFVSSELYYNNISDLVISEVQKNQTRKQLFKKHSA